MKSDLSSAKFWRGLDELAGSKRFQDSLHDEFATPPPSNFNRRDFLKLVGASLALTSLPACTRQPIERIVPYTIQPEHLIPGKPIYFATAMTLGGFATGLVVESHEGHPTKIEGNPSHPASLGATSIFHQAAILNLYDPGRSQSVLNHGQPATWTDFVSTMNGLLGQDPDGKGLRILTEPISSPTLHSQIQSLLKQYPAARWHQFSPANRDNSQAGSQLAFGEILEAQYQFDKAKIVFSLDADFLDNHPNAVRLTRDFSSWRRARQPQSEMNRLYVVESSPSVTGSNADHRLPVKASEIINFAFALTQSLKVTGSTSDYLLPPEQQRWVSALAEDLNNHRGQSVVVVGENQPPIVHALAHRLNHELGNIGSTVLFTESAIANPVNEMESLQDLCASLEKNEVDQLIILGGNPVFNAPADLEFADKMSRARFRVHFGFNLNETANLCDWHIPENHFLESWSDARAFDGTVSIMQPLILPLYAGKSVHEVVDAMLAPPGRTDYEIIRDFWTRNNPGETFSERWRRALHEGFIKQTTLLPKNPALRDFDIPAPTATADNLEICFRPDPTIRSNDFSYNVWLHELPKPLTKLVWDNPALISLSLAKQQGLSNGDVVRLEIDGRQLSVPVWITPGQPDQSITMYFGCGSVRQGKSGEKIGFDVHPLRSSVVFWKADNAHLTKTGENYSLVTTQTLHAIDSEERQIIREGTLAQFQNDPDFVKQDSKSPTETLFKPQEFNYNGYRWGMSIDLSACIGCSACVMACQSENNIPTVGKTEVSRGRIMHWIRIDTYFRGVPENPQMDHQPVPCMQCENAPCELVCPVGATLHDKEGLNLQVYNRCVGTRYCSNNCPYKVRRFNFFEYADYKTPSLKPMWNPNVTVRGRGVMEKCTYCVQRISARRIGAEEQGRKIYDGELLTACQQVCPARAIVFGDLSDPDSKVSKLKSHHLDFLMLSDLNTRPRTSYLARLRNPNPKLNSV